MRYFIFFLCLLGVVRAADIIPAASRPGFVPGTDTGVLGGIPANSDIYTTITTTGDTTDRTATINAAIANAGSANKVVLLGPGTFYCDSSILFYNSITPYPNRVLRGSGIGTTTIIFTHASLLGVSLGMGDTFESGAEPVTVSASKGDTSLTIGGGTAVVTGDLIRITQDNVDTTVTKNKVELHVTLTTTAIKSMYSRVTGVAGNVVSISPGLYFDISTSKNPIVDVVYYGYENHHTGIEDMTLSFPNKTSLNCVVAYSTRDSWIKNVKIEPYQGNLGVYALYTVGLEIRKSEIAAFTSNGGSNRAAIQIDKSSAWLVEDNIIRKASPHLEISISTSGGSFSYNYCENTNVLDAVMGSSINANHGPHTHNNLFEGNYTNKFQSDGYFGSSSDCFLVRNVFHGTNELGVGDGQTEFSVAVNLNRFTRSYYVVGNIIGVQQSWVTSMASYTMDYRPTGGFGYATPVIYAYGYPAIGGGGFTGNASAINDDLWADYRTAAGPSGYQEMDDDVVATTTYKGNWNGVDSAIRAGEALGSDTVSNSYAHASKPSWFGSLAWPPYDATTYTFTTLNADAVKIPAGYRAINGNENYLTSYAPGRLRILRR